MAAATKLRDASSPHAGSSAHLDVPAAAGPAARAGSPAGPDVAAALSASLALGLRASYRHLASLHLASGSPARAAAMLQAAENLGGTA